MKKLLPKHTLVALGVSLSIAASCTSSLAYSQDSALEHITVQAQKTAQNLQEVPVAVTALSGDDLIETVVKDVFDLQNYVPAFGAFQNQSVTNSGFSIRGIGTSSQNFGFESSVGLYVDGVYRSRQNALINDLVDIAAIEVLRGPQGTLFGKNTAAGAMTLTSVAPSHTDTDGFVEVLAGNDSLLRVSAGASFSLIDDVLAMRISGFKTDGDGYITDATSGQSLNNKNRSAVKAQWLYTPTENLSVRIIADYGELNERCCGALTWQNNFQANEISGKFGTDAVLSQPPFNATIYSTKDFYDFTTSLSQPPLSKMEDKGVSAQIDVALNAQWSLVGITAYRAFDSIDIVDTDFSDADLLTATNDAKQQSFSQELRLHYKSDKIRGLVGAYYFSQNLDLTFNTTTQSEFDSFFSIAGAQLLPLANAIDGLSAATGGLIAPSGVAAPSNTVFMHTANQEQDSIALFAQADWLLSDSITLTTGLRFTDEKKSIDGRYTEQGPGIDGLNGDPESRPNIGAAVTALNDIGAALITGTAISPTSLNDLAPFQQPGWGYFFLGSSAVLPRPDLNEEIDDSQLTGTVKLAYQPNKNQLIYASLATGYKAGGTNTDRILPSLDATFEAEKARSAEIGLKQDWPEYGVRVNVAAHYSTIKDFQATTFTGTGFNLQNAGDIHVKGLELETTWLISANTELQLNASRTLANFDTFKQGTCWVAYSWHTGIDDPGRASPSDPYCARDGDRVGFEPQNSFSVLLNHHFSVASYDATISADYQYTGDVYLDDSNDPYKQSGSYEIINARLALHLDEWDSEVIVWARNLLDEEYIARSGFDVPVQEGKIMAYAGAPRTFGVSVRKRF